MPAQDLPIDTTATAVELAQTIFGAGVTVDNATYTGDPLSSGIYTQGDTIGENVAPSDTGVILSTGHVGSFTNAAGVENQFAATTTDTSGPDNVAQFNAEATARTFDAAYLDVDFRTDADLMTMQFVFSSEEYPEFTSSIYQDFVGVWINGTKVEIDAGNGDIDPGNVNTGTNANLFVDNTGSDFNTEMDGFTLTLSLTIPVSSTGVNSLRIAIADVADPNYDSNLLIAANSVQTALVAQADTYSAHPNETKTVDVLANDVADPTASLTITHINGTPVTSGSTVLLPSGQQVQVNGDGTLTLIADSDVEDYAFTYKVSDGTTSDTGIVNVSQVPCFVAGTLIDTPAGPRPVETLQAGDLVTTRDQGPLPLRWTGQRTTAATGPFAPISIAADTYGSHGRLMVSPLHRILIRDVLAQLLFGEEEVLVAARDLVNGTSVLRREGGSVTYVHLLFDQHQVVYAEGLATESFLPGPQTKHSFEAEIVDEICALFPDLDPVTGDGYGPPARRALRAFEAQLLTKVLAA